MMDSCRWALRKQEFPKRVISIGARLGYDDDGETPNTLITLLDYEPAPIIFEVRGLPKDRSYREGNNWSNAMDEYRGVQRGTIVQCEGGFVRADVVSVAAYDNQGRQIRTFSRTRDNLYQNFINAVRTRRPDDLYSDALEGHLSCGLVHMANIPLRIGQQACPDTIREAIQVETELCESFGRLQEHLAANRINLQDEPIILGPMLTMDSKKERFVGQFDNEANGLVSRAYRKPFVVPEEV